MNARTRYGDSAGDKLMKKRPKMRISLKINELKCDGVQIMSLGGAVAPGAAAENARCA
jgi:hypothetical protein